MDFLEVCLTPSRGQTASEWQFEISTPPSLLQTGGVELLTLKILFLIFFEFCYWNLKKKFEADVLICVRVKLDKIWAQCIESEKKFLGKKAFFSEFFFFFEKKILIKKMFFFENNLFSIQCTGPKFYPILLLHISKHPL